MPSVMLMRILILCEAAMLAYTADSCETSRGTVVRVNKCPENKAEWMEAAKRKNCTALAGSCSESDRFVYHCVLNPFVNETLEVCAYGREIFLGRCTEYSILGNLIQESGVHCTTFPKPCPAFYQSNEAYKYQDCYKLVQKPTTVQPTTIAPVITTTGHNKTTVKTKVTTTSGYYSTTLNFTMFTEGSGKDSEFTALIILSVTVMVAFASTVLIVIVKIFHLRKRKLKRRKKHKSDETFLNPTVRSTNEPPTNASGPLMETCSESQGLLTPSGEILRNNIKAIEVHKAEETRVDDLHEFHSKDVKGLLERLDDVVQNLVVAKSLHVPEEDSHLSKNLQHLYEPDTEFSNENIPLLQNCIQEVVEVHNYFEKSKHKSKQVKPI